MARSYGLISDNNPKILDFCQVPARVWLEAGWQVTPTTTGFNQCEIRIENRNTQMTLDRRTLLTSGLSALSLPLLIALPAWATGGNDPIPGIDIIILEDPASRPIPPFSLSGGQLDKLNELKGEDGARFLSGIISAHLTKCCDKPDFNDMIFKALAPHWCAPCKMANSISFKFGAEDTTFTVSLKIKGG
jgi:hypothetical protein